MVLGTTLDPQPYKVIVLEKKKTLLKWVLLAINVIMELLQAVASQEAGDGNVGGSLYRKLTAVFSCICLLLSILELVLEAKRDGGTWQSKRGCYCFYYRIFGRFPQWFGLISVTVQFSLNMAVLVMKRGVLKFDHVGLLLSVGYFLAALIGGEHGEVAKVRCCCHGSNEVQGKLISGGMWEFECPHSTLDKLT